MRSQLLTESLILAMAGGALGVLVGRWAMIWFVSTAPGDLPRELELTGSAPLMIIAVLVALASGLLFGVLPALHGARSSVMGALRASAGRSTPDRSRQRAGAALVIAEIAISFVLLIGASLLARSFLRLQSVDPGFRTENLLTMRIALPSAGYTDVERVIAFFRELPERISALPAVSAVSAVSALPASGGDSHGEISVEGRAFEPGAAPGASYRRVLPNYFATIGIPLIEGREFNEMDHGADPKVVIINEMMARRLWPTESALGKRIKVGPPENEPWLTVVGVVGDVRNEGLETFDPYATYEPHPQRPWSIMYLIVRTERDPAALTGSVRAALKTMEPEILIFDEATMRARVSSSLSGRRFYAQLIGFFGASALGLAALGVYGLIAYTVAARSRELGIRVALGAQRIGIVKMVLRHALLLGAAGAAIGLFLALALSQLIRGMLYDVSPVDPATFVAAAFLQPLLSAVAALIPARRATAVDPLLAMRD